MLKLEHFRCTHGCKFCTSSICYYMTYTSCMAHSAHHNFISVVSFNFLKHFSTATFASVLYVLIFTISLVSVLVHASQSKIDFNEANALLHLPAVWLLQTTIHTHAVYICNAETETRLTRLTD